jgi:anti-sigma B factor antagonist
MDVTITDADGVTTARLSGRLDTANVNQVELSFTAGIVPKGQPTLVDLSDVSFIASLGIRMLLTVARALGRSRAQLVLFAPGPMVMEILETTAISEIIPIFGTEAEARAALAA